ncbi:MAG: helix-turn-helix domain-containing protein [Clostridia bacterium]|nr:helix-turn-helix domain-containing protein [Clostridia bacterium]
MIYQAYRPEKSVSVEELYSLHYFNFEQGYVFPGEKHSFWELVYADMGGATLGDNDSEIPLSPGQCFLHAPDAFHTIHANLAPQSSLFVISFSSSSEALSSLLGKPLILNTECRRIIRRILIEAQAFCGPVLDISNQEMLIPSSGAPYGSGQVIQLNLELLLILLLRQELGEEDAAMKRAPITEDQDMQSIVAAAEAFMRSHLDGSIHLDDICKNIGVSRTTLKRLFRQTLSMSVMEHYQSLRLQEACRHLRTGRVNVSQIAYELGYSSLPAFSRQFKQILGITPREYILSVNDNVETKRKNSGT